MGIAEDIERELATDHHARKRAREDILLRFRALSWQDQYKVFEVIQGYFFHDAKGRTGAVLREVRDRAACIEAVARAARHLGLPAGEAPGVEEYDRAQAELGLDIPSGVVRRRWHSWPEVRKAVRGEPVRLTARQRAGLRAAIRRRHTGEEWLEGVREWLREGGRSTCQEDYDAWARERNACSTGEAGGRRVLAVAPVALSVSIEGAVLLPWSAIVRVAQGHVSLADAQARALERFEAEDGEFVSRRGIALLRGMSQHQARYLMEQDGFPAWAFTLSGARVWRLSDVRAHQAGEAFPARRAGELQGSIMSTAQVRAMLGLSEREMKHSLAWSLRSPPRVGRAPRPAGKVATHNYWFRISVEAWLDLGCGPGPESAGTAGSAAPRHGDGDDLRAQGQDRPLTG